MRTLALLLLVGLICLAGGFYAGSAARQRAHVASGEAALRRAGEAMAVGRQDEALEYAFAALDRNPDLYGAYELAGDAVIARHRNELARHYYRAALGGPGTGGSATAGKNFAADRARIQAKIAALDSDP
jgi:Tfp pilus assembly protein PilF